MPLDAPTLARYKNRVFVETGSGTGGFGIKAALACGFERIISIEFDPSIFQKATAKFTQNPEVTIVQGDSAKTLPRVIRDINEPMTFWLDAHGKSGDTTHDLRKKPLLAELGAIAAHPLKTHTILIDDWDIIESPKWCPHLTEQTVRAALAKIRDDYLLSRIDAWVIVERKANPYWQVMVAEPPK